MKCVNLNTFKHENFEKVLNTLITNSSDRNKDWFPNLLKNYKSSKYLEWFFVLDNLDNVLSFSTIQDFNSNTYRLLTRCYISPEHRRTTLPKFDTYQSLGSLMIKEQLKFLGTNYESIFISLEYINRKRAIINLSKKMSFTTNLEWEVGDGMFLTCENKNSEKCWQNICYSKKCPALEKISYEEWIKRYANMYNRKN
jgi:hypothetical protein